MSGKIELSIEQLKELIETVIDHTKDTLVSSDQVSFDAAEAGIIDDIKEVVKEAVDQVVDTGEAVWDRIKDEIDKLGKDD